MRAMEVMKCLWAWCQVKYLFLSLSISHSLSFSLSFYSFPWLPVKIRTVYVTNGGKKKIETTWTKPLNWFWNRWFVIIYSWTNQIYRDRFHISLHKEIECHYLCLWPNEITQIRTWTRAMRARICKLYKWFTRNSAYLHYNTMQPRTNACWFFICLIGVVGA